MTKEELEKAADEYEKANYEEVQYGESYFQKPCVSIAQAFMDGAEFAYQWHDLRKNPNDLPEKDCTKVMFVTEYKSETLAGTYINGGGEGTPIFDAFGIAFYEVQQVIAWCELPKFKG